MGSTNQYSLFWQQRFAPFFTTQFLGAFNDNLFKTALVVWLAFSPTYSSEEKDFLINVSTAIFILPFFLFSSIAGQLADKYDKAQLIRHFKWYEILIAMLIAIAFYFENLVGLILLLFLSGTQSTFFGPVKYSILPQHLAEHELVGGNGLVEMATFIAILFGSIAGALLIGIEGKGILLITVSILLVSLLGYATATRIPPAPANAPSLKINWNIISTTVETMQLAYNNPIVFRSIVGISWFWFYGTVLMTQLASFVDRHVNGDETVATVLMASFSVGIAIGSLLCERLSDKKIEMGIVPIGSILLCLFCLDLSYINTANPDIQLTATTFLHYPGNWRVMADVFIMGFGGGVLLVPLYTLIQHRAAPEQRSRIIAANNIMNALFMTIACAFSMLYLHLEFTIPQLYMTIALLTGFMTFLIFIYAPEFIMRSIVWLLIHTIYRLKREDLRHIPKTGGAVLISNHVSFVDALVIMAVVGRPIRFVIDETFYNFPLLHFVLKTAKTIPIDATNTASVKRALDTVAQSLEDGELIGIFPEGEITRNGEVNPFKRGIERIIERTPVPVLPLALQGLWGSFFSRKYGKAMSHFPRRMFWCSIGVVAGPPVPPEQVEASKLHQLVEELRGEWR